MKAISRLISCSFTVRRKKVWRLIGPTERQAWPSPGARISSTGYGRERMTAERTLPLLQANEAVFHKNVRIRKISAKIRLNGLSRVFP